jgi:hypothetical protein
LKNFNDNIVVVFLFNYQNLEAAVLPLLREGPKKLLPRA